MPRASTIEGDGGGRCPEPPAGLLERDRELAALDHALAAAIAGDGRAVLLEGEAGLGKSALLESAAHRATALGFVVLSARGDELIAPVAGSLATGLLRRVVRDMPASQRRSLFSGAAAPARSLFATEQAPAAQTPANGAVIADALVWVVSALAEDRPLALMIDDVHWADTLSLRFLAHLAGRVGELAVALTIARRRSESGRRDGELLDRLAAQPGSELLVLAPLSVDGSVELAHRRLGDHAGEELAHACAEVTRGNPFYLNQLLVELHSQGLHTAGADPKRVRTLTPASVTRVVLLRLARLGSAAVTLAQAVAVLGSECALPAGAALAGLERTRAVDALDALIAADILRAAEPLEFAHPLVRSTIYGEIPIGRRGELHLRAARMLADAGADPQLVAAQLLATSCHGEDWAIEPLRRAARLALRLGDAHTAASYLQRALEASPAVGEHAAVIAELARAETAAGRPAAIERFETLLELTGDHAERARIQLELGRALASQGRQADALAVFDRGMAEEGEQLDDTGRELRAAYWMTKSMATQLSRAEVGQLGSLVEGELQHPTTGERALLAGMAMASIFRCDPREQMVELARRAWDEGALLAAETSDGLSWTLVTGALQNADELDLCGEICERALADARRRGSRLGYATASFIRSGVFALMGRNDEAIADLEAALDARQDGWAQYADMAAANLCLYQLERGSLDGARAALQSALQNPRLAESIEQTVVLIAHGELLLRDGHPAEALEKFETAGAILTPTCDYIVWAAWRPGAVRALLALDDRRRARELASEAVAHTRRVGAPSGLARALRALAQTERGQRALDVLEEAVSLFEQHPQRREHAYALIEYGAALRRAGRRAAARKPLRGGLELARRGGLQVLAAQAVQELAAAGARTPRHTLTGAAALTPTERRVVELAARDLSNRQIAQQLFVTVKSVEYHLGNAYRKLDVRSRTGLAAALSRSDTGPAAVHDRTVSESSRS